MQIDPIKKYNNKEEKSNIPNLTKVRDILLSFWFYDKYFPLVILLFFFLYIQFFSAIISDQDRKEWFNIFKYSWHIFYSYLLFYVYFFYPILVTGLYGHLYFLWFWMSRHFYAKSYKTWNFFFFWDMSITR